MIYTKEKLEEKMKKKEFFNFYVFYGEEKYLIESFTKKMLKAFDLENFLDFNFKKCFFEDFKFDELETFLNMAPVFSLKRVFLLKDVEVSKLTSSFAEKLKKILKDMPETSVLILTIFKDPYSFKKTSAFKKLVEEGAFVEFLYKSEKWIFDALLKSIKKKGLSISKDNLIFFIRRSTKSIENLKVELEKIFSFVLEGEIKKQDILNLTSENVEENAFNITKNILAGNKLKALKIFNDLKKIGTNDVLIFSAISCCFVDLYRAKCAKLKGVKINDIVKIYDYKGKEFRIKNAMLNCDAFSIERLKKFVVLLADLDVAFKTKNVKKDLLLEKFLFSI